MNKTNPFKRELLRYLLEYCYPSDQAEGFGRYAGGSDYLDDPRTQELRDAVIDTLRAYATGSRMSKKAFTVLQRAHNEPVKLISSTNLTNPPKLPRLFMVKPSFENQAREVADGLRRYLKLHTGPPFPFVCKTCEKVTELTKPNRTFCSEKCRNDFWNSKKMEAYHRNSRNRLR